MLGDKPDQQSTKRAALIQYTKKYFERKNWLNRKSMSGQSHPKPENVLAVSPGPVLVEPTYLNDIKIFLQTCDLNMEFLLLCFKVFGCTNWRHLAEIANGMDKEIEAIAGWIVPTTVRDAWLVAERFKKLRKYLEDFKVE
jgi:hypothetical protein